MAEGGALQVEGINELVRAFGRVNKKAAGQVRKEMRGSIGKAFVQAVKDRIESNSLVRSGKLRGSIRPSVKGSMLIVRSSPPLRPGNLSPMGYAAIYEFGGSTVRSVKLKGGGRGFSAVKNRSGQGAAAAAHGPAQGSLGQYGPRAFLLPTLDEWRDSGRIEHELNNFLDWVEKEFAA